MSAFAPIRPFLRSSAAASSARSFSSSASRGVARFTVTGRLPAQPEASTTATGKDVVKYSVATSYGPKNDRKTSYFRISSYPTSSGQKEHLVNLPKGSLVYVEADAAMHSWEDDEGKKRTNLRLTQRVIEILKRGNEAEESE